MSGVSILAHGLGGRSDLPLPAWMFGYGAAITLLISFAALAVFWPSARLEGGTTERTLAGGDSAVLRAAAGLARVAGLGAFLLVLVAAVAGDEFPTRNLAPVTVYVVFWVGVTFATGLFGDVWKVLSPFDTLALLGQRLCRLVGKHDIRPDDGDKEGRDDESEIEDQEDQDRDEHEATHWGYWPAAAGLLVFVWVELVYPDRSEPRTIFWLMAAYSVVMLACAARFGRDWLRRGEAFAVLFGIIAHVAPLYRDDEGRLRLRPPFVGLARLEWEPGLEAVVLIALGSTTFDGLTRTQFWVDLTSDLTANAATVAATVGLAWTIGVVSIAYIGAMRVAARLVDHRMDYQELRAVFVHSLVPIVLAYAVAHYFSLLMLEGQAVIALISNPLDRGWDLFGTADRIVDYTLVTPAMVAYIQCGAIVVGHVAGVVVAHDRALALFDSRTATRSQYPLLAAMVLFTLGGLFLLLGG